MFQVPKRPNGIVHPSIEDMYVKTDYRTRRQPESVLVIRTFTDDHRSVLMCADINEICHLAEEQCGKIDRVDITTH